MTTQLSDHQQAPDTTEANGTLDAATLHERMGTPTAPRVLDVRTAAEFETSHIPGAYNVPLDTLKEHRDEIRNHLEDEVVLVCRTGQRASQAGEALTGVGLPNARVLDGGMLAWEKSDGPVIRGKQRWDLERQVRLVAGSIVLGSIAGSVALPKLKWVAGFVGGGLTFAAVSNTCTMGLMLSKLPYNRGAETDPQTAIRQLAEAPKETA